MAKKYLLYIHHPAFEAEAHKSDLVNQLLRTHYGTGSTTTIESESVPANAKKIVEEIAEIQHELDKPMHPNFNKAAQSIGMFCKHGYNPSFCKFAKPGKPCK